MKPLHWWLLSGALLILTAPFLLGAFLIGGIVLSERPAPYSHSIRLSNGATLIESGTRSQSWDGDGCSVAFQLDLKHRDGRMERIESGKQDQIGTCGDIVSRASLGEVRGAVGLQINDSIWSQRPNGVGWAAWTPNTGQEFWRFVRWNPSKRIAVYTHDSGGKVRYRVYRATDPLWRSWRLDAESSQQLSQFQRRHAAPDFGRQLEWEVVWVESPRQLQSRPEADFDQVLGSRGARIVKRERADFSRKARFVAPQKAGARARSVEIAPLSADRSTGRVKFRSLCDNWDAKTQGAQLGKWLAPSRFGGFGPRPLVFIRVVKTAKLLPR